MRIPLSFEFFPPKTPEGADKLRAVRQAALRAAARVLLGDLSAPAARRRKAPSPPSREILAEGCPRRATSRASAPRATRCAPSWPAACDGRAPPGGAARRPAQRLRHRRRVPATRATWWPSSAKRPGATSTSRSPAYPEIASAGHVAARPTCRPSSPRSTPAPTRRITQYFFNADAYFRFVDEPRRRGVDVPVVPGVMPITSSTQLMRFSDACGAEIPRWIRLRLQGFGDDMASIQSLRPRRRDRAVRAGCAPAARPALHFYTMNQAAATAGRARSARLGRMSMTARGSLRRARRPRRGRRRVRASPRRACSTPAARRR